MGRFARLQDMVGDKLLPVLLTALGEAPAEAIDNLDRAEHLGFIVSADEWVTLRTLRNQMAHEYPGTALGQYASAQPIASWRKSGGAAGSDNLVDERWGSSTGPHGAAAIMAIMAR